MQFYVLDTLFSKIVSLIYLIALILYQYTGRYSRKRIADHALAYLNMNTFTAPKAWKIYGLNELNELISSR
jgi:hypothetical protein